MFLFQCSVFYWTLVGSIAASTSSWFPLPPDNTSDSHCSSGRVMFSRHSSTVMSQPLNHLVVVLTLWAAVKVPAAKGNEHFQKGWSMKSLKNCRETNVVTLDGHQQRTRCQKSSQTETSNTIQSGVQNWRFSTLLCCKYPKIFHKIHQKHPHASIQQVRKRWATITTKACGGNIRLLRCPRGLKEVNNKKMKAEDFKEVLLQAAAEQRLKNNITERSEEATRATTVHSRT